MLDVTHEASQAINTLTGPLVDPPQAGLRIAVADKDDSGAKLGLAVVERPAAEDELVTSDDGAKVFLQPEAARFLTDKVLDVSTDAGGRFQFEVHGKV
jgi:Fe-S cluster assembly iron-binding protein IscA